MSSSLSSVFRAFAVSRSFSLIFVASTNTLHTLCTAQKHTHNGKFRENNLIYYPLRVQFLFWFCLFYNHFSFQSFGFLLLSGLGFIAMEWHQHKRDKEEYNSSCNIFFLSLCQSLATLGAKLFHFDSANNNCVICSESFGDTIKYSSQAYTQTLCRFAHNFYAIAHNADE